MDIRPCNSIEELRQFVRGGSPQEGAQRGDAGIPLERLGDGVRRFLVPRHGPEFVDFEPPAIDAGAVLLEQHRAGRTEFDRSRDG
jgi:hypothetical protein